MLASASPIWLDRRRQLVVVAPHPDDEVIGFGGALYDHAAAGGEVVVVAVTDGEAFDPLASADQRDVNAEVRRNEQVDALERLGIAPEHLLRLGLPDGDVKGRQHELDRALDALFDSLPGQLEPIVVVPWRGDHHPDHEATSLSVRQALGDRSFLEVPIWSWRDRDVRLPEWSELAVIPLSDAAQIAKRAALRCHRSQLLPLSGGRPPILSASFVADFDRPVEVVCR